MARKDIAPPLTTWKSYEYFEGGHIYRDTDYQADGGPDGTPCVWADDSMWTIDTPEQPHSILFLLQYRFWNNEPPVDLRQAELSFRLRGDSVSLFGARCYFWAVTYAPSATRWHFTGCPIPIADQGWGDPVTLRLVDDPAQWHRSFSSDPAHSQSLDTTLATCFSYGFSLVGFSQKVRGRIGLSDFRLAQEVDPSWPYVFNGREGGEVWMTISAAETCQLPVLAPHRLASGSARADGAHGPGLYLHGDYLSIGHPFAFVYLAMVRASDTTGGRDLRNAMVMIRQVARDFDGHNGKICFFVEHAASETRWVLMVPIENRDNQPWCAILSTEPSFWGRLSGSMPLEDVLAGSAGRAGYDYFGIMLSGQNGNPSGTWGLTQFSIGPTLDPHCSRSPDQTGIVTE